jgi:hypothetical protein
MISDYIKATEVEMLKLFENTGTSVLRDTGFDENNMPVHQNGCVVIRLNGLPDSHQLLGGTTKLIFDWSFICMVLDANPTIAEDNDVSYTVYDIVDTIMRHFNNKEWLTDEMKEQNSENSYKLEYQGTGKTETLSSQTGCIVGFEIKYTGIALDKFTVNPKLSEETLQKVIDITEK